MEVPEKVVLETAEESTESVVLQCTSSGDVEDGEEVARAEGASERGGGGATKRVAATKIRAFRVRDGDEEGVGRTKGVRAWGTGAGDGDSAYWNTGGRARTKRWKESKECVEDGGEGMTVEKTHVKRMLEESEECGRFSDSQLDEGTDSDAASAASSSSDSGASESEEEISWKANKRRRAGFEAHDAMHLKFGSRRGRPTSLRDQSATSSQRETSNCDSELKEMQLLLELQLKASERREAGMKLRMETMMDLMSRHMGHVEKRVCTLEVGAQPQEQVLERINVKLERVMEGFTTLNANLSLLSACLSRDFDSR